MDSNGLRASTVDAVAGFSYGGYGEAAQVLLRHSIINTTLAHYIKDVPEVTTNGMAQVEELFSQLDAANQAVQ